MRVWIYVHAAAAAAVLVLILGCSWRRQARRSAGEEMDVSHPAAAQGHGAREQGGQARGELVTGSGRESPRDARRRPVARRIPASWPSQVLAHRPSQPRDRTLSVCRLACIGELLADPAYVLSVVS